ncbi:unnamed protein product [Rhizoctonia solani]|uniref:Uncharacterized protein n=1 Tax=Rhizoctonia solani TaxID=456999 RepID=A0A8H2XG34_9AGAM|nr:unnamed protein product [Rhizoctonia solani]
MSIATGQAGPDEPIATCLHNETEGWSKLGERNKDVCHIAQSLMNGTCHSYIPTLHIIPDAKNLESIWYTASRFNDEEFSRSVKRCVCDRVMFNLLSACAGCQKWEWSKVMTEQFSWQGFTTYQDGECSGLNSTLDKRITWVPEPPTWAKAFNQDTFDPTGAQSAVDTPETTSASSSSSPSSTLPASKASQIATGDVPSTTPTGSGLAIGAIVGGVIGGLVFLGAIAGLAFWLYRRKRRTRDVAPSAEFLKREYFMEQPPLLPAHERRESAYRDEIEEEDMRPSPTNRRSWVGGFAATRRHDDEEDSEMLPPFTQGTYIGPSPHEKGHPERRETGETDITVRTENTTTFFLPSASPTRRPGPSDHYA